MSVKRYEPRDPTPTQHPEGSYVLASDYDSLLAVLRRCVTALEHYREGYAWYIDETRNAKLLADIREFTEAKP